MGTREKLLRQAQEDSKISTGELATTLIIARRGAEWQIQKLKPEGLMKRIGPGKGWHWKVKS